ncbi:hypothetical protein [Lentilactobacillus sp. Marseille-Q4993]|uniref:hypothetical protein n=1 Tax=Lentilactobacillus sp. Marseille-Q4993 TaxID=3039492 RepID=UPI0024BC2E2C|nr:hypothetical protein [Lentilactobacillus sp. Marseille-Q4993]
MKKQLALTAAMAGLFGVSLMSTPVTAQAKYVKTPVSLRGKWRSKLQGTIKITRYTFATYRAGHYQRLSGVKNWGGNLPGKQLIVSKRAHGYYLLGRRYTDDYTLLKRVRRNGRLALKNYVGGLGGPSHVYYYYKVNN